MRKIAVFCDDAKGVLRTIDVYWSKYCEKPKEKDGITIIHLKKNDRKVTMIIIMVLTYKRTQLSKHLSDACRVFYFLSLDQTTLEENKERFQAIAFGEMFASTKVTVFVHKHFFENIQTVKMFGERPTMNMLKEYLGITTDRIELQNIDDNNMCMLIDGCITEELDVTPHKSKSNIFTKKQSSPFLRLFGLVDTKGENQKSKSLEEIIIEPSEKRTVSMPSIKSKRLFK